MPVVDVLVFFVFAISFADEIVCERATGAIMAAEVTVTVDRVVADPTVAGTAA